MHPRAAVVRLVFVLCVALGSDACRGESPSPPKAAARKTPEPPKVVAAPAPTPSVLHTIGEGETLWDIARAYGVTMKELMAANDFDAADIRRLRKGAQIKVPGAKALAEVETKIDRAAQREALPELSDGAYHFLHRGESLWTIARAYDVPIESLMERNGFSEDVHGQLRVGQPIIIPGIKPSQVKQVADAAAPKRVGGVMHEVSRGESVWEIARTFQVSTAEIMAANGMTPEEAVSIRDGQRIFLPGVEDAGGGRVRRKQSARERRAELVAKRLGLGSLRAAGQLLHGHVEPRWIKAAGGKSALAGTLRWPVAQGWFVRGYGSGQGGYHKAMDIMGRMGWNVRAAADGIVGYSGDQVPGFGNMIMVVHPGGWVTLYAHNSVNFVAAGEKVSKGAILAEVGSTGRSMGPHVHFELIFDGKNCNPAPLFRPGVRHRNGKRVRVDSAVWRNPAKRPGVVACAKRQKHPLGQSVQAENPETDAVHVPEADVVEASPATDDDAP